MYDNIDIGHDLKMVFEDGYQAGVEAAQPKWISVEDRLPNDHGNFITKIHCDVGDWIEVDTFDHTKKEWWHDAGNRTEEATEYVTHWLPMPIPEPPIVMATKGGDDYDIG